MSGQEIEKQILDARRRYKLCEREINPGDWRKESSPLNAARGFRSICDLLFAIVEEQRRQIEQLQRSSSSNSRRCSGI